MTTRRSTHPWSEAWCPAPLIRDSQRPVDALVHRCNALAGRWSDLDIAITPALGPDPHLYNYNLPRSWMNLLAEGLEPEVTW